MVNIDLVTKGMKLKLLSEHGDSIVKVVGKEVELPGGTFTIHVVDERYPNNKLRLPVDKFEYVDKPVIKRRSSSNPNLNRKSVCKCAKQLDASYMETCNKCGGIKCPKCNKCGCNIEGWDNNFENANKKAE